MKRTSVNSSYINSIGYEEESKNLEIEFHDGDVKEYYHVPLDEYNNLMNAESIGYYFTENIQGKAKYHKDYMGFFKEEPKEEPIEEPEDLTELLKKSISSEKE